MKINWKDETSYSRGQYMKVPPNVLKTKIEGVTISIHRHIHYPGTWLLTCRDLGIEREDLYTDDFKDAEKRGIETLLDILVKYERLNVELLKLLD